MSRPAVIAKAGLPQRVPPNMPDYDAERASFSWERARSLLDGLPGGRGLNIAHECVDRHAAGPRAGRVALRHVDAAGARHDVSFAELAARTSRFANVLRDLGVEAGETVATLLPRMPALHVTVLGALKNRSVACPLFAQFGPEPLETRLGLGRARVLVTTEALYRRKVAALRPRLPQLEHVLLVGGGQAEGTRWFEGLLAEASPDFEIPATSPRDPALLHFTSGTTGMPKGALHVHEAIVAHHVTGLLALDLHDDDVFWCTADAGWVTGTSYGLLSPLSNGVTSVVDEGEFDAERWYALLERERVSVWYTAPTAIRMLMRAGTELPRSRDLRGLRFIASVGEPLNPEAVWWGMDAFGQPIHDNWWQTETGGIMIANYASVDVRPGSMGRPLPGIEAAVVRREEDGSVTMVGEPGVEGELALAAGWPSMFATYLGDDARYQACFAGLWYLTGDLAKRDSDGWFWFVGRADDVIKTSGHLIGPFEVESALMEHDAVSEAAVIGKPDPVAGNVLKAFVVLEPGRAGDEALAREILGFARARLGPAAAPKEVAFADSLPRTRSGKILRRLLKARELGLPEGDLSTLEAPA